MVTSQEKSDVRGLELQTTIVLNHWLQTCSNIAFCPASSTAYNQSHGTLHNGRYLDSFPFFSLKLDCYTFLAWWHCRVRDMANRWLASRFFLISPFLKGHWQSPYTDLTAGKCLPLGLCKETVKESSPEQPHWAIHHRRAAHPPHWHKEINMSSCVWPGFRVCH